MPASRRELVLTAHQPTSPADEGNLLLDRLFGARVHFVPAVDPMLAVGHDEDDGARRSRRRFAPAAARPT